MKTGGTRASALLLLAGVLAAAGAFTPCRGLVPPPLRVVDPATASLPELLTLPGVGRVSAEAMWAERVLGPSARARAK
jgi:hypothetical protein